MSFPTTHPALARALAARGYDVPTDVQLAVLEARAAGRDLLVSARTGSGKTVAFGLALGDTLLGEAETFGRAAAPLSLIIAPTRELAMQVCRELTWLYEATGARVVTCVGGMDFRAEARELQAGAHIVVGTPGRLRDHIERRRLDLGQLRAVVLDEADEMLDLGFREDLEFILEATPAERRTLMFSATLPRAIEALARRYQREAVRIETVRRNESHADIEYRAHRVAPGEVEGAVVNVLRFYEARAALVFCSTRGGVNRLSAALAERGFSAVALSGELTQNERTHALQALRSGRARVLVATDVAARGLDVPDLSLVVHAELPNDAETMLHRSGRTGRAGKKGLCVLIVPHNRRRKAEALIGAGRLDVTWAPAPTTEEIRARDQERFLTDENWGAAASEAETKQVAALQAARSAHEIALALIRAQAAGLPSPVELSRDSGPTRPERRPREPRFAEGGDREGRQRERHGSDDRSRERRGYEDRPREQRPRPERESVRDDRRPERPRDEGRPERGDHRREGAADMVWFRINIGRERNADPRWLLPLICRAGEVTKGDIGAIRVDERHTMFQISAESADQFEHAVRSAKKKEGQIVRVGDHEDPPTRGDRKRHAEQQHSKPHSYREPSTGAARHEHKRDKKPWSDRQKPNEGGWVPRRRQGGHGGQSGPPGAHGEGGTSRDRPQSKKNAN